MATGIVRWFDDAEGWELLLLMMVRNFMPISKVFGVMDLRRYALDKKSISKSNMARGDCADRICPLLDG